MRHYGAIPERQHDAFLLALLIAVSLNIAFFALQSLLPPLLNLLRFASPVEKAEETAYFFEYVDPSVLDEPPDPDQIVEAESTVNRRARQTEAEPDLPDGFATVREGIDDYLSAPDGNPGENIAYVQSPGRDGAEPEFDAEDARDETHSDDIPEPTVDEAFPDPAPTEGQTGAPPDPPELTPLPEPPEPEPPPPPEPERIPDPAETFVETPETPEPPSPDSAEPREIEEGEIVEPAEEFPAPEPETRPSADMIDLASLPVVNDGFFDPETRRLEEIARRRDPLPQPVPQWRAEDIPEIAPATPAPSPDTGERRRGGRRPTFKSIGAASEAGGAPPRRNESTSVKVLDADASMALLAHRYGPYMRQVWEKLQASLMREMVISPLGYSRGQVKIRFGISADGSLSYQETIYPDDGSMASERAMSERMLREAGPFDPLTPTMQRDELFQKMTVIVNLY